MFQSNSKNDLKKNQYFLKFGYYFPLRTIHFMFQYFVHIFVLKLMLLKRMQTLLL